jgi:hypothetical protein
MTHFIEFAQRSGGTLEIFPLCYRSIASTAKNEAIVELLI